MADCPVPKALALWAYKIRKTRGRNTILALLCIGFLIVPMVRLYNSDDRWSIVAPPQADIDPTCRGFPRTEQLVVSVKTRAANSNTRLPAHFQTHLQCIPDVLVFSDLEQNVSDHKVHDTLDRVSELVKLVNKAFSFYEEQKECAASQIKCRDDPSMAAELEKLMTVNMVARAWELRPNRKWYVFIEDDTYVIWSNLVYWLRKIANRKRDPFVGSVVMLDGYAFANGGSGFALSGDTVNQLLTIYPDITKTYDKMARKTAYGGVALAKALDQVGVQVKQAHPMFNGERPSSTPFGRTHWCQPVFTMASMNPSQLGDMWKYEQTRQSTDIIQYRHLYHEFVKPHMPYFRREWDNHADETCYVSFNDQGHVPQHLKTKLKKDADKTVVEKYAHKSPASCARVCEAEGLDIVAKEFNILTTQSERGQYVRKKYEQKARHDPLFRLNKHCFQWRWESGVCCTSTQFMLGEPLLSWKTQNKKARSTHDKKGAALGKGSENIKEKGGSGNGDGHGGSSEERRNQSKRDIEGEGQYQRAHDKRLQRKRRKAKRSQQDPEEGGEQDMQDGQDGQDEGGDQGNQNGQSDQGDQGAQTDQDGQDDQGDQGNQTDEGGQTDQDDQDGQDGQDGQTDQGDEGDQTGQSALDGQDEQGDEDNQGNQDDEEKGEQEQEQEQDKGPVVTSGWFIQGISDWIETMGDCDIEWKEPTIPT